MRDNHIITVDGDRVVCEGSPNLKMGHPRIYLHLRAQGNVTCPYCGAVFMRDRARVKSKNTHSNGHPN